MIDFKQPYGTISGHVPELPGVRYVQDGKYFDAKGNPIGGAVVIEPTPAPVEVIEFSFDVTKITTKTDAETVMKVAEQLGIEYTNKQDAVKAIKAHGEVNIP